MDITVRFAALAQGESQTSKALLQRSLDADLKPQIVQDLADAVKLEREEHGSAATAIGQFWVIIYAIFCREYVYVGSAGTRKASSKAKGEELVKACNDLKAEEFLTALVLALRLNEPEVTQTVYKCIPRDSIPLLVAHMPEMML